MMDGEFAAGYSDGRDASSPAPGPNRSASYAHSWRVGRAEVEGRPIPASVSRQRAAEAERKDQGV